MMEKFILKVTKSDNSVHSKEIELIPDNSLIPNRTHTLKQLIVECIIEEDPLLEDAIEIKYESA